MLIALAQLNPLVGDIDGNVARILDAIRRAEAEGAGTVVFSELAITGYPPKDLLLKKDFIEANVAGTRRVAAACERMTAIVGFADPNPNRSGRAIFNAAAVCRGGRIEAVHRKALLPTYDVFDESRYFEPSPERTVITLHGRGGTITAGLTICEDLWNEFSVVHRPLYHVNPVAELAERGAKWIVNLSASPFELEKEQVRLDLFSAQAATHRVGIVYVNQVGGNDDLLFDGASAVFDATGRVVARARAFDEDLLLVDLDRPESGRIEPYPDRMECLRLALVVGLRDYVRKCGFRSVVLGLSGGVDSALVAALAAEALGPAAVRGVAMPSRYSSDHSLEDAKALAANLGITLDVVPIDLAHKAMETILAPAFVGRAVDSTEENVQARLRGTFLMALSNKFGSLLLTTGNKSELAVGYCTMYGDMCGGLAVISDVPKTTVYELARYLNRRAGRPIIPERTITKPPSAELRPNQTDQDTLPPYEVLDALLKCYVEGQESIEAIVARGFDRALAEDVIRRVDRNEYKRRQAAPGLKVTTRAFGVGRRMPIAARYNH